MPVESTTMQLQQTTLGPGKMNIVTKPVHLFAQSSAQRMFATLAVGILCLTIANPAEAFRCKSRIIKDGMHQAEVIRLCGQPVSIRDLGYVVRSYSAGGRRGQLNGQTVWRNRNFPGNYLQEVLRTEMLFNFGPRKLMRHVVFEGGLLTSIRTMGYGYVGNRTP